jgi:hypothetical protein
MVCLTVGLNGLIAMLTVELEPGIDPELAEGQKMVEETAKETRVMRDPAMLQGFAQV